MSQDQYIEPLAEVLAAFRATRSVYQSTSDQALTQLLISLAEEVILLGGEPAAESIDRGSHGPDMDALQAQLARLKTAYQAQHSELARLRALVGSGKPTRQRGIVISPPRVMRSIEYWEAHVPDYGDTTSSADIDTYRTKRRVRPEDVVLTEEDRARMERRRRPVSQRSAWMIALIMIAVVLLLLYLFGSNATLRELLWELP